MNHRLVALSIVALLALPAARSSAALISLSEASSNATSPSELDATFEFIVTGSNLSLIVTNNSLYNMTEIYFNGAGGVTDLVLTPVTGWTLSNDEHADGFGVFEYGLLDGVGPDPDGVGAGEMAKFDFTIVGTGPFSGFDFTTELSTIPPGNMPSIVAAKFVAGPGGNSAHGATQTPVVPAPPTFALLGLGLLARRRRRAA